MVKVKKLKLDTSLFAEENSEWRIKWVREDILPNFDIIFEEVRQHNMDLYGAVGSRLIRNKKYQLHKKLKKFVEDDILTPMLKAFLGFYYDIYSTETSHKEEVEDLEYFGEVYEDIKIHDGFDTVVFCSGIVHNIVSDMFGSSDNLDKEIRYKNEMEKVHIKDRQVISIQKETLKKYSQYVQLEVGDLITFHGRKFKKVNNILHEKNKVEIQENKDDGFIKKVLVRDLCCDVMT